MEKRTYVRCCSITSRYDILFVQEDKLYLEGLFNYETLDLFQIVNCPWCSLKLEEVET
jgi:hypothetical protein